MGLWLFAAPPMPEDLWGWIGRVTAADPSIDPSVVVMFNLMGVWPLAMLGLFAPDLLRRPLPALPFVLATFFLGVFVLLPWLGLRPDPQPVDPDTPPGWLERAANSRWLGVLVTLLAAGLWAWGLGFGDWAVYGTRARHERLPLRDDDGTSARSGPSASGRPRQRSPERPWQLAMLPVVGAGLWLIARAAGRSRRRGERWFVAFR